MEREVGAEKEAFFPVVGIGASAGGLEALQELFAHLPKDEMSCVVVQHLDPVHESLLAGILSQKTKMTVREAKEGAKLAVNCVYTIPPNTVIRVVDGVLRLSPRNEMLGLFLPIDQFFRSLAQNYGGRAIGIVLSGGGSDGSLGIQEIKACGGIAFAQDESTARVFTMPQNAIATGAVDFVLSPRKVAERIGELVKDRYWAEPEKTKTRAVEGVGEAMTEVLRHVFKTTGIDFSSYKAATLKRRISRRMQFRNTDTVAQYLALVKEDASESHTLCQDILIQVTRFFREPESYELLKTTVFPDLFKGRASQDPIRIWVVGCSSGEEAYSILIALSEYMSSTNQHAPVQLFGTDINDSAIQKARAGTYGQNAVVELSPERLANFFSVNGSFYSIKKSLRDLCIFAKHNVLSDPPFAKVDLLSCQNVMIYFDASLQKRVLSIFQYSLKAEGVLLLGPAESIGSNSSLFTVLKPGSQAFKKVAGPGRLYFDFVGAQLAVEKVVAPESSPSLGGQTSTYAQVQKEADRWLVAQFSPPGVIFNDRLEVIQFKGQTGPYFEHSPGYASLDLLKMLRGELIADVRHLVDEASKSGKPARKEEVTLRANGHSKRIALEVCPIRVGSLKDIFFLLTFEDLELASVAEMTKRRLAKQESAARENSGDETVALRAELAATKEYLQAVNEEKEAANEELRAANEEVMSTNEELQSTNEEMHTAKEELQSTNEELLTVNDELQNRNREFFQLNNDLTNLFTSLNVAVVMLDKDLRIRKFTPMAEKLFRLIETDVARKLTDIRSKLEIRDLEALVAEVIRTLAPVKIEAKDGDGNWYSVEIRPYRTNDDKIDGAILLFTDINQIKAGLGYAAAVEETLGHPLLILTGDLKIKKANEKFHEFFQTTPRETDGRFLYELGDGSWNTPKLKELLEGILTRNTVINNFEMTHEFPKIGRKSLG